MPSSFAQEWVAEMFAMTIFICIGTGVITNKVLPRTKGSSYGFGFIALAFGLGLLVAGGMFGGISAVINPTVHLARALNGIVSWKEALLLMLADFVGSFLGALLNYTIYLAHFSVVPIPPKPPSWTDPYVRPQDTQRMHSAFVSFDGNALGANRPRAVLRTQQPKHVGSRMLGDSVSVGESYMRPAFGVGSAQSGKVRNSHAMGEALVGRQPSATMSMAAIAESAEDEESGSYVAPAFEETPVATTRKVLTPLNDSFSSHSQEANDDGHDHHRAAWANQLRSKVVSVLTSSVQLHIESGEITQAAESVAKSAGLAASNDASQPLLSTAEKEAQLAYEGALVHDQNCKLSAFCGRPAIYMRPLNFLNETIGAFILSWCALMIREQNMLQPEPSPAYLQLSLSFNLSCLIIAIILGIGGQSGPALNCARDFSPRLAHWLLPVPNKGPTEWQRC
eukprot:TRINITY_DN3803_c0_g2_i4.p1 TRINITY_DN3803_c0_g2~~TRINITY_DN3803_c0_g2_i4.p1  ORF type:complete len:451 (-),score=94.39 TRINITY_DN3803_c0_g2_i4:554-1906(-)